MAPTDRAENAGRTPGAIADMPKLDRGRTGNNGYSRGADNLPPGESPADSSGTIVISEDDQRLKDAAMREAWCIEKARACYTSSTDYITANVTSQWERALNHFQNKHSTGRPYARSDYKRSRVFRPKTRTMVKGQEAAITAALFSTLETVTVDAVDPLNPTAKASAEINKNLMNYRLHRGTIPWFLTTVGAFQDTKLYGVCVSHQLWDYRADTETVPAFDSNGGPIMGDGPDGEPVQMGKLQTVRVRSDKPVCNLIEPENFRFDPMADWRDPVGTSPYIIMMRPMYASDVMEEMERTDEKTGQPIWRKFGLSQILATRKQYDSQTRRAREGTRTDPAQEMTGTEYSTVWAHFNVVRVNGDDLAFWTLGTELLLTDPVLLADLYPWLKPGERPFVLGISSIEAHKNYPSSDADQGAGMQEEINDIANQRMDNVKLVLNKRYHVRRGSQVDLDALIRNVPGGGVHMNDVEKDVKVVSTPDVTASSYQEQDRLSVEFDDLLGSFTQTSVQNNRNMNETVGGMDKMGASANAITDYSIRIFATTWIEPVLRQLVRLEQQYETDEAVLAIAGSKSKAFQRLGGGQITDELIRQDLLVQVDMGIGNTDPVKRVERLTFAIKNVAELPTMAARLKSSAISNEVFGALGYRDGSQFVMTDEEFAQYQQENPQQPPPEIAVKMEELRIREEDNVARDKRETIKLQATIEVEWARLAVEKGLKLDDLYMRIGVEKEKLKSTRDMAALDASIRISDQNIKRSQAAKAPAEAPGAESASAGPPQQ